MMDTAQRCPVCAERLDFHPWNGTSASDEICPGCGIQFGYNDARSDLRSRVYDAWRDEWITNGRQPITGARWREVSKRVGQAVANASDAG